MPIVVARGLLGSLLVLLGGSCYARTPRRPDPAVLRVLHGQAHPVLVGGALALSGLVLLTWAWWDLRGRVRGRPDGVRLARIAAAVWSLPLMIAPPLFSNDGWSYVATGYLTRLGWSPYTWTPAVLPEPLRSGVDPRWINTPTPYGALPLEWGSAFAHLTANPWLLLVAYRLLALVGLVLLAWAVPRLARRAGQDPAQASVLVVASPFVVVQGVAGLHNDLVMAGLMMVALVVARPRWWPVAAALAGLAASVKAPGGLVAVGVVLLSLPAGAGVWRRLRRTAEVGVLSGGTLVATGWVSGLGSGWLSALTVPGDERTPYAVSDVIGVQLRHLLHTAGGTELVHDVDPVQLAKHVGIALLVGVALWVLVWRPLTGERSALVGAAIVLTAGTVLSPAVHYWYFLWCLPLLACLRLRPRAGGAVVALVAALGPLAVADPALHHHWLTTVAGAGLVGVPLAAWLLGTRVVRREECPAPT